MRLTTLEWPMDILRCEDEELVLQDAALWRFALGLSESDQLFNITFDELTHAKAIVGTKHAYIFRRLRRVPLGHAFGRDWHAEY